MIVVFKKLENSNAFSGFKKTDDYESFWKEVLNDSNTFNALTFL